MKFLPVTIKRPPLSSILAPLSGLAVCILIIITCGKNPSQALVSLFTGTFTSTYYFGSMLNTAAFLMTAGAGAAIAMKSGNMNLGGEGQVYAGGYVTALVLGSRWASSAGVFTACAAALFAALATGALLAAISALLKELRGAQVLLTSFLVSAALLPLIDGLLISSMNGRTEGQHLIALPYIPEPFRLPRLLAPSPLTVTFFFACAICLALWLFLAHTTAGRHTIIWGKAPLFARASGYSSTAASFGPLAVSGALHALTGFFAVCGTYYTCHKDFYVNMGWNGLSCALIVSARPLALIPSALVLSWLYTSAGRVALTQGFGFDISGIIQGVVLFAIAIPFFQKEPG
ncbi:MAG: hypothetical protein K6G80_07930 [Treponema sp.]|nr:hypothetical protein [Treponema sp.]